MSGIDIRLIKTKPKTAAMRRAANITSPEAPIIMAIAAKPGFMATRTEVLVCSRSDRMAHLKIVTMHIDQVVAILSHLVSKSRLVALQTIFLRVTSSAIDGVALGFSTMI